MQLDFDMSPSTNAMTSRPMWPLGLTLQRGDLDLVTLGYELFSSLMNLGQVTDREKVMHKSPPRISTHKTKGCHRVVIKLSTSCHLFTTLRLSGVVPVITSVLNHMVPTLGCHSDNFLVVLTDNLDNFLCDNHKVVIVTIRLTTFWQLFVLCAQVC